jgi:hypothetical protein
VEGIAVRRIGLLVILLGSTMIVHWLAAAAARA